MKFEKVLLGIVLFTVLLFAGCDTDPGPGLGPSKTTHIDEIALMARYYNNPPANWTNGWESSWQDEGIKLTNLLPEGIIKNDTQYDVTITGSLDIRDITTSLPDPNDVIENTATQMTGFQFVFTIPQLEWQGAWDDLSPPTEKLTISEGSFSVTRTLTTTGNAVGKFNANKARATLAFTNETPTEEAVEGPNATPAAVLTNVDITITEILK